ncbi:MAG TPA: ABC transporter permease subunit [Rudaea sp.]|nr:ABC transporter permease subunit [Rudaea sp.]
MSWNLARNELRRAFVQPMAWALLATALCVLAYFFLLSLNGFLLLMPKLAGLDSAPGVTDLIALPLLRAIASVLLLVTPLLGMRAIAGERQNGTLPLLLGSGLGSARIVLGKYLGLAGILVILVVLAMSMPFSLAVGTTLDMGRLLAAMLGLLLFAAALAALALCVSTYAQQPMVAAIVALALNLLLWMVDAGARYEGVTNGFINYLALPTHLEPFLHGIVASVDVVYFVLLIAVALALATRQLASIRVRG